VSERTYTRPDGPLVPLPPVIASPEAHHPHRLVPLEGAHNFRDLGGYTTTDGRQVRWGRVYRSDHLNGLTDSDRSAIAAIGLKAVVDFRLPFEREQRPSKLPDGTEVFHFGMSDGPNAEDSVRRIQRAMAGEEPMPDWDYWYVAYHAMLDNSAPMFVNTMTLLAEPGRLPALYHCTGGKDRTGLASVFLLDLLGVPAATVLDDFELTNLHRTPVRVREMSAGLEAMGVPVVDALPILGVVRAAMHDAYNRLITEHGGAERYLVERGLDPSVPGRLRELLLVPV
jgi:protein-tyrosine phosphatase